MDIKDYIIGGGIGVAILKVVETVIKGSQTKKIDDATAEKIGMESIKVLGDIKIGFVESYEERLAEMGKVLSELQSNYAQKEKSNLITEAKLEIEQEKVKVLKEKLAERDKELKEQKEKFERRIKELEDKLNDYINEH